MLDLLPYVSRIINAVSTILTLVGLIQQKQETLAQETTPYEIQAIAVNVQHQTLDVASFAGTIPAQIKNLTDLVGLNQLALLTAIGAAQQGGAAVTLPAAYPSGWAAGINSDTADGVWNAELESYGIHRAGESLRWAGYLAAMFVGSGTALAGVYWNPSGDAPVDPTDADGSPPLWNNDNILADDTLLTFAARENSFATDVGWHDGTFGHVYCINHAGNPQEWLSTLDEVGFEALRDKLFPVASGNGAPIWPGLAGVTLLTPVAFSDSFTISETMQGVLIAITSAPSKQGTFDFDGLVSYRNAGAVAFVSDDGQAELSQPLGFTTAVYCPHSMAAASSVKVRVTPGLGGTCTPFTIP